VSAQLQVVGEAGDIASPADLAHSRLREAIARIETDRWGLMDAIHYAYEVAAWTHDDGEHVGRYELIMYRQGLGSIFDAYCSDEFGLRNPTQEKLAGQLRATVDNSLAAASVDWRRISPNAARPINSGVLNQFHGEDIAKVLVTAQEIASKDAAAHPKAGHNTPEAFDVAPVTGRHVTLALAEVGLVPHKPEIEVDPNEAAEVRMAKLRRLGDRAMADLAKLIVERQRKSATDIIISAIRRLGDHPASLTKIREALDEVTPA
jgi:hypothetical protein